MRDCKVYLEQILEMIEKLKSSNLEKLEFDDDLFDATVMRLQVIGESAGKIPLKIKKKYTHISWDSLVKMRDFVSHNYERIDIRIMKIIITDKVLPIEGNLKKMIGEVDL